jgi:hypothetical protein
MFAAFPAEAKLRAGIHSPGERGSSFEWTPDRIPLPRHASGEVGVQSCKSQFFQPLALFIDVA